MGPKQLLLVDDHVMVRDLIRRRLLEVPDFEIVGEAGTAEEAFALAREREPDVVLLDIQLPDLGGAAAAQTLCRVAPRTRILAVSQYTDPATVLTMLHYGATGYVAKTAPFDELVEAVRTVARGRQFLCSEVLFVADISATNAPARHPERLTLPHLTARELEVLTFISIGLRTRDIAGELGVSERTIESYRRRIGRKLGSSSVAAMTKHALREKIVNMDGRDQ